MPGISGELDEHPANRSDSNMMAIAMRSMRTWWYPSHGISPVNLMLVLRRLPFQSHKYIRCMPIANLGAILCVVRVILQYVIEGERARLQRLPKGREKYVWKLRCSKAVVLISSGVEVICSLECSGLHEESSVVLALEARDRGCYGR
jgi:hypothetical protein